MCCKRSAIPPLLCTNIFFYLNWFRLNDSDRNTFVLLVQTGALLMWDKGKVWVWVFVSPVLKGSVCAYQRADGGDMYLLRSEQLFNCRHDLQSLRPHIKSIYHVRHSRWFLNLTWVLTFVRLENYDLSTPGFTSPQPSFPSDQGVSSEAFMAAPVIYTEEDAPGGVITITVR